MGVLFFGNIGKVLNYRLKMSSSKAILERIKEHSELTKYHLAMLRKELKELNDEYNLVRSQNLLDENAQLTRAVAAANRKLQGLEHKLEIQQYPTPYLVNNRIVFSVGEEQPPESSSVADVKAQKEKKPKEAKEKVTPAPEAPIDVGRLDLRVAKVEQIKLHPDADSLYVLKINCGEDVPRNVCSGLVKFIPMDELKGRSVVLLCNLKPVKIRGVLSEAMVMCASTPEKVEVLSPPAGCVPGEPVQCEGYPRVPDFILNPKKKIFETVAPDLHTDDSLQACYKGVPFMVPGKGNIVSQTLKNVAVK